MESVACVVDSPHIALLAPAFLLSIMQAGSPPPSPRAVRGVHTHRALQPISTHCAEPIPCISACTYCSHCHTRCGPARAALITIDDPVCLVKAHIVLTVCCYVQQVWDSHSPYLYQSGKIGYVYGTGKGKNKRPTIVNGAWLRKMPSTSTKIQI